MTQLGLVLAAAAATAAAVLDDDQIRNAGKLPRRMSMS